MTPALQRQQSDERYVTTEAWDEWDRERVERARADLDRNAWKTAAGPDRTTYLLERIEELEDRLYTTTVLLESSLELLNKRAAGHARTLELVAVVEQIDHMPALERAA